MTDNLTFSQLKYADLLGKPLTKSLYRQLSYCEDGLLDLVDDQYAWAYTMHGKVNWCPPHCSAETFCRCEGECRRHPRCKQLRSHQHLLLGREGVLAHGLIYRRLSVEDNYPMRTAWWSRYEPLSQHQQRLQQAQREYQQSSLTQWVKMTSEERAAQTQKREETQTGLTQTQKALATIDMASNREINAWIQVALDALPVILLRG